MIVNVAITGLSLHMEQLLKRRFPRLTVQIAEQFMVIDADEGTS
jgi:hypothetical protein